MNKTFTLTLMALIVLLWAYPFYDSIMYDARSMADLSYVSQVLVWAGLVGFAVLVSPLFVTMWRVVVKWVNGKI